MSEDDFFAITPEIVAAANSDLEFRRGLQEMADRIDAEVAEKVYGKTIPWSRWDGSRCGHTLSRAERDYCASCVQAAVRRFSDLLWLGSTGWASMTGTRWRLHA